MKQIGNSLESIRSRILRVPTVWTQSMLSTQLGSYIFYALTPHRLQAKKVLERYSAHKDEYTLFRNVTLKESMSF